MKKLLLSVALIAGATTIANAQETVANLFEGSQFVNWDNTLYIEASKFENASVGDYIFITFSSTTDVIELKSDGVWLPGSRFSWLGEGVESYRNYITEDGLATLQDTGLELCGGGFTVTGVSIMNDGFVMPEGAVWGGFFWVDNWNTLEIFKTAFENYDGQRYLDIYLADDNTNGDYFMKVLTQWEPVEIDIATNEEIEKTASMATVDLQNVNLPEMLADVRALMIQANPEEGGPFNITAVALRDEDNSGNQPGEDQPGDTDAVNSLQAENNLVNVFTVQGVLVKKNIEVSTALNNLPKGVYLIKGGNYIKKVVK